MTFKEEKKNDPICLGDVGTKHVHVKDHGNHMHVESMPFDDFEEHQDEAALAADIQKLMNPNKEKHEKMLLDQRFEEVISLIRMTRSDLEHTVTSDLIRNRSDIEGAQRKMFEK